jgi:hypothetical protein
MERARSVRLSCPKDNLAPFHEEVTMLSAAEVMRLLDLKPHPEGGHYRQTFRDRRTVDGARAGIDGNLFPAGTRRALALAQSRCGRGLALLCWSPARARDRG